MPREEYERQFGNAIGGSEPELAIGQPQHLPPLLVTIYDELGQAYRQADDCPCDFCAEVVPQTTRFPLPVSDADVEQALQEIDWFGITRSVE